MFCIGFIQLLVHFVIMHSHLLNLYQTFELLLNIGLLCIGPDDLVSVSVVKS